MNQKEVEEHVATLGRVHAGNLKELAPLLGEGVLVNTELLDATFLVGELLRLWKLALLKMQTGATPAEAAKEVLRQAYGEMHMIAVAATQGPLSVALFQVRADAAQAFRLKAGLE